jgi:type IV pilus assembly protein PilA
MIMTGTLNVLVMLSNEQSTYFAQRNLELILIEFFLEGTIMNAFLKRLRSQAGFTLVELMVVVAIIGLLSAVAIPNFKKYQAKSKTSEAKLQLAALYTAETSFFSDFDTYHICLAYMGYNPSNEASSRYYSTGFNTTMAATTHTIATTNGADGTNCANSVGNGTSFFAAGKKLGSTAASTTVVGTLTADEITFTAGASGIIDKNFTAAATMDSWNINETKLLKQTKNGY